MKTPDQFHQRLKPITADRAHGYAVRHGLANIQAVLPHALAVDYAVIDPAFESHVLSSFGEATLAITLSGLDGADPAAAAEMTPSAEAQAPDTPLAQIGRLVVTVDRRVHRAEVELVAHPSDPRLSGARMHLATLQIAPGQEAAKRVVKLAYRPLDQAVA